MSHSETLGDDSDIPSLFPLPCWRGLLSSSAVHRIWVSWLHFHYWRVCLTHIRGCLACTSPVNNGSLHYIIKVISCYDVASQNPLFPSVPILYTLTHVMSALLCYCDWDTVGGSWAEITKTHMHALQYQFIISQEDSNKRLATGRICTAILRMVLPFWNVAFVSCMHTWL